MKLSLENLSQNLSWKGYRLPQYDIQAARDYTKAHPVWLHFGAGNLFRAFPAVLAQRLLTARLSRAGVICCEGYDEELIDRCYRSCDHLSIVATVYPNGTVNKEVVASVTESLKMSEDEDRLRQIFTSPDLQMVSFTITEKGYVLRDDQRHFLPAVGQDILQGPQVASTFAGRITALCLSRARAGLAPVALVSLDNCQNNSHLLRRMTTDLAGGWLEHGHITQEDFDYITKKLTYPLSMIDKITPHPDERVCAMLQEDGLSGMEIFTTAKSTVAAAYVNSERPQHLLIENDFPNGHPAFEQLGVILTSRSIVEKSARMKACTCMNPMDTALGLFGCLLGYTRICDEMQDPDLVNLITRMSEREAMPLVTDPGVIDPFAFLHEVLGERYPNPFLQDTPQRIATDTSRKLAIRFGETLKAYYNSPVPMHRATHLTYIPLVLACWLRYLVGVDDEGQPFQLSPDARIGNVHKLLGEVRLGDQVTEERLYPLLSSTMYFGINLFEVGVGERVVALFNELNRGPHAVRETLHKYCGEKEPEPAW